MSCPLLKTLRISFTAPNPIPENGYRIKWRVVGTSTYTTAVGPFISSPAELTNIPACENIEGTVEAVCGATYSSVATFTAAKETTYVCGATVSGSISSSSYYTYPKKVFDLEGSGDNVTVTYDVLDIPNRINVYNSDDTLVANSGWKGVAAYAGPWGSSLNTSTTGYFTFTKSTSGGDQRWYYITAEHSGNASQSDGWEATLTCAAPAGGGGGGEEGGGGTTPSDIATANWSTEGSSLSSGKIVITRTSDDHIVFEHTSIDTYQTGSVELIAGVQYTITGLWNTGSGNIVRTRVCDITNGGQIGYSGDLTNMDNSWSVNITPATAADVYLIKLTSGADLTPGICPGIVIP